MKGVFLGVFLGLLLVGCATDRPYLHKADRTDLEALAAEYNAKIDDPNQEVVCKEEKKIGSHIPRVVCRTRWAQNYEEREASRYVKKPRPVPTNECGISCL